MGCSERGGNDSTEVLHGEIINYNSGARMAGDVSAKTCGEICSLTQDFSLSVPAFIGSQIWRPLCRVTAASVKDGKAAVFQFYMYKVFCIHKAVPPF